jgi:hypothetical protein
VIIAVPADTPDTIPVELPTTAIEVNPGLLQAPPGIALLRVISDAAHTLPGPAIADGTG